MEETRRAPRGRRLVHRVLTIYEAARKHSLANYDDVKRVFIAATKLPEAVVDKQLKERTELTHSRIGAPQNQILLDMNMGTQRELRNEFVSASLEGCVAEYVGGKQLDNSRSGSRWRVPAVRSCPP